MSRYQYLEASLLLAFLSAGLHGQTSIPGKQGVPPKAPAVASQDKEAAASKRTPYTIGPQDYLFIRVWEKPELSGAVSVGPDGMVSVQLIGEVKAAGLTPRQLEEELAGKLKKFYKDIDTDQVNVQVTRVNSRTYIIQGEVGRPGVFPITKPITIMEALVSGGGFGPFANKKKIYLLRGTEKHYFNWVDVSKGKHLEQNIEVQNGDQIFVP